MAPVCTFLFSSVVGRTWSELRLNIGQPTTSSLSLVLMAMLQVEAEA